MEKVTVLPSGTDLNTVIESGIYRLNGSGETFTNGIGPDCGWGIMVVGSYIDTTFQELYTFANRSFTRMRASAVNWSSWARLATATKPQVYDLPLAAGITAYIPCTYRKTQDNEVKTHIRVSFTTFSNPQLIVTLPEGYRPTHVVTVLATIFSQSGTTLAHADMRTNGDLYVYAEGATSGSGSIIVDPLCFIAA